MLDRTLLANTRFAREHQQNLAIKRYEEEENELGEYHETLDWLLTIVEEEIRHGIAGPIVLTRPS